MYRCATCGGNHRKVETAKRCAEDAATRGTKERARDQNYDSWVTSAEERESARLEEEYQDYESPPNGHYFIPREHWSPDGLHVWVRRFDSGRWEGVWFITAYEDGKPQFVSGDVGERQFVIEKIMQAGALNCMVKYGTMTGRCGICNEELEEGSVGHIECFRPVFKEANFQTVGGK